MFPNEVVGEQIEVKLMEKGNSTDVYPGWFGHYIPIEIIADYPKFYLCRVLPHINPMNKGYKTYSKPYQITINKWDIGRKWKVRGL